MKSMKYNVAIKSVRVIDILLITALFAVCWFMYYAERIIEPFSAGGNVLFICFYMVMYSYFARLYDGFKFTYSKVSELIYSQVLGFSISDAMVYVIICFLSKKAVNILPGFICFVCQSVAAALWAFFSHKWYFSVYPSRKSAVICESRSGIGALIREYGLAKKYDIQRSYSVDECLSDLSSLIDYKTVFLSDVHSHERNTILKFCVENDITAFIMPGIGDMIMSGARHTHLFHIPILRLERYNPHLEFLIIKRLFDIFVSACALIIFSPVIVVVAAAVKLNDGGPVLYKQCRLTKDGKKFNVLKFRSMRVDAEKNGAQLSSGDNDDRITPVGRIIRKLRIDELPQLWNILAGDMSIVGPRPERPEIAEIYEKEIPEFRLRLQAKAGLTGYAQVYGKYNTTPYDKLIMDLMYISNPSVVEDLKIMFATVKILFMSDSTEGVAEGQTTAIESAEEYMKK